MRPIIMLADTSPEIIGPLPFWLQETDPRPAAQQLNEHYAHGGGWQPFKGFKLKRNHRIQYPGDEALAPLAMMKFRDEMIVWYPHAWIMILQKDGSHEICRMD